MADFSEPPAKKVRLDVDAPGNGSLNLDAPSSPIDDFEDDFYETSPADPTASGLGNEAPPSASTVAAETASVASSLPLPGLGFWSEPSVPQAAVQTAPSPDDGALEDGELSDDESFYNEVKPTAPVTAHPQALEGASQHNGHDTPAVAALDVSNGTLPHENPRDPIEALSTATATAQQEDNGKTEFLQAGKANKGNANAEWQLDSEAESDSSSDSSSGDSSSDDDSDSDGELLTAEEAVKRLMAETSDDPAPEKSEKPKTQNEVDEEFVKPNIQITNDTKITELGTVESVVGHMVVVKGNTPGNDAILESGSALCLGNRTVIGQISEAIGRVNDPRYSFGFADATEITTLEITKGTPIFYVDEHSTFVYTEPLRKEKHTDASGQYDEEAKNPEFSDDEKEAEHKQRVKREKDIKRGKIMPDNPSQAPRRSSFASDSTARPQVEQYTGGGLKYSDDEDEDLGMYRPLTRPDRFEDLVGAGAPIEDRSHVRRGHMRGGRGWLDRGRGFRGRGGMGGGGGGGRADRGGNNNRGRNERGGGNNRGRGGDRGGMNNSGRGDRGGMAANSGRGDRGGMGANSGRGDRGDRHFRGQSERGDRSSRGRHDRDEHSASGHSDQHARFQEQNRQRGGSGRDNSTGRRAGYSPAGSPPRQNQGHQVQHSPPRGKSRKRNRHRSPARSSQPPETKNLNAYASNSAQSGSGWNATHTSSVPATYTPATATPSAPAYASGAYASSGHYPQQDQSANQAQANQAQWAQWLQLAAAHLHQTQAQPQQAIQQPPQPQQQPQAQYQQYPYPYQQHTATVANPQHPNPQSGDNAQAGGTSLQDLLRVLGNNQRS